MIPEFFYRRTISVITASFTLSHSALAEIPAVPKSQSPDGKIHALMNIDRDPKINPEWKGGDYPKIEITETKTGKILASIVYTGAAGDDTRPLREHVNLLWRADSQAFAITITDRFYSHTQIFILNEKSKFVTVPLLSYEAMTGFPDPDVNDLRPRGYSNAKAWNAKGHLIYTIFLSPLPSYKGKDPLSHEVVLEISRTGMKRISSTPRPVER